MILRKGASTHTNIHVHSGEYRKYEVSSLRGCSGTNLLKFISIDNEFTFFFQETKDLRILRDLIYAYLKTGKDQSFEIREYEEIEDGEEE